VEKFSDFADAVREFLLPSPDYSLLCGFMRRFLFRLTVNEREYHLVVFGLAALFF